MIVPGTRRPPADKEVPVDDEYIEAVNLNAEIMNCARTAQENLYQMAMGFKRMRDEKLYKALGYDNFGEYCEGATGLKRRSVYGYIQIVENLPIDFVQSTAQIGKEKMLLLANISDNDRTEITETLDLESTTVKELKEKIKQIEKSKKTADTELDSLNRENIRLAKMRDEIAEQRDKAENRNAELMEQIKDLESRPIEVAVQTDSHEIENLKDAMKRVDLDWAEKYSQLEEENLKERRELMQKVDKAEQDKQEELTKLHEEYEKKLAEKPAKTDDKETFKAYLSVAVDSVKRLCDFVKKNANSDNYKLFREKSEQLAGIIKNKLEESKNETV